MDRFTICWLFGFTLCSLLGISNVQVLRHKHADDFIQIGHRSKFNRTQVIGACMPNFWEWCWDQM